MSWKPLHEAHAIDRVRMLISFDEPLPDKPLSRAANMIVPEALNLGFDTVERAASAIQEVTIQGQVNFPLGFAQPTQRLNGWVLKRQDEGRLLEEAGYRDAVFGFMTVEYTRWVNVSSRFWELFEKPLELALESVSVQTVKIEYWDQFIFDGEVSGPDARELFREIDSSLPADVIEGGGLWHSHIGWFEHSSEVPVLINRNIDMFDRELDGVQRRVASVYTMADLRVPQGLELEVNLVREHLDFMHKRLVRLFGETIQPQARAMVGIKLEAYVQ